jgi:uncharacterized protein YceK
MEILMSAAPRSCALLLVVLLTLAGCGSSSSGGASDSGSTSKDASSTTIDITFKNDTVTPQGKSVSVKAGTPFTLKITADKPGELHVHSSPESEVAYKVGTTTKELTIDKPGVVDVESHDLGKLVVQLQVR